jgi:hypothetical protein
MKVNQQIAPKKKKINATHPRVRRNETCKIAPSSLVLDVLPVIPRFKTYYSAPWWQIRHFRFK